MIRFEERATLPPGRREEVHQRRALSCTNQTLECHPNSIDNKVKKKIERIIIFVKEDLPPTIVKKNIIAIKKL